MLPGRYKRVQIKQQAGLRFEEFDFSYYNRTPFVGLENDLANAYTNALIRQVLSAVSRCRPRASPDVGRGLAALLSMHAESQDTPQTHHHHPVPSASLLLPCRCCSSRPPPGTPSCSTCPTPPPSLA